MSTNTPQNEFWEKPDAFLTVKQVAGKLNKSESTVRRWVRLNMLEAVRVGRTLWIHVASVKREIRAAED